MKEELLLWQNSTLNSYSQVFFSTKRIFGILLLIVTFLDPYMGVSGLIAILFSNFLARWYGFDLSLIKRGDYGFNSLLVGLGLSSYYDPGFAFFILLLIATLITFLLTILVSGVLYKYGLPYLSIPFLLTFWVIMLASRNFESLGVTARGVFVINEMYSVGNQWLVDLYHEFNTWPIHDSLKIYIKSLGAIFFQFNIVAGLIIAIGILYYSRIAFSLSLISFYAAYLFYILIGAEISELSYSYIGFNFILTGIAIGAFFLIPSWSSYIWNLLLIPVLVILTSSFGVLFSTMQLGIYSLPFNMVVITFLYSLNISDKGRTPTKTAFQLFSPEWNLYEHLSSISRYGQKVGVGLGLPVMGEWLVSQGPSGSYTHKGFWKDAWDFVIVDKDGMQYVNEGDVCEDYFCYDKPVCAPAPGTVVSLVNTIEDNEIGKSDVNNNWGNSIVIEHSENLYSQVSHLKKGSVKVKVGEEVVRGQLMGTCGNSGRSPYPHLHYQIQLTPEIGSRTHQYPIDHYLVREKDDPVRNFMSYSIPTEGERISSVAISATHVTAMDFQPGQLVQMEDNSGNRIEWEVIYDEFNNGFFHCKKTDSKAWFRKDEGMLSFTFFEGDRSSLLNHLFCAMFSIPLVKNADLKIKEELPLYIVDRSLWRVIADTIAPFVEFRKAFFELGSVEVTGKNEISVNSATLLGQRRKNDYNIRIREGRLLSFSIQEGNDTNVFTCVS